MARGVLYIMTTIVPGLIKIGKTTSQNFDHRMYGLEHNGYFNITGLKRKFAIEVEDCDEKEIMLDSIFDRNNISGTELFAMDENLAVQLLSSFDGTVIYPKQETKDKIFDEATADINKQTDSNPENAKSSRFKFSMIGLEPGTEITFLNDPSKKAIVADDVHVIYEGETWSMSKLAKKLGNFVNNVQGPAYFTYHGKKLTELREEMKKNNESA